MSIYVAPYYRRDDPSFGTTNNLITLDATISENHNYTNVVQSHPVEKGESITDDSYHEPIELELECVISPYAIAEDARGNPDRADKAYRTLIKLRNSKTPVTVMTGLTSYRNMAITTISIPRSKANSQTLRFTINFRQVRIVGATTVALDVLDISEDFNLSSNGSGGAIPFISTQNQAFVFQSVGLDPDIEPVTLSEVIITTLFKPLGGRGVLTGATVDDNFSTTLTTAEAGQESNNVIERKRAVQNDVWGGGW